MMQKKSMKIRGVMRPHHSPTGSGITGQASAMLRRASIRVLIACAPTVSSTGYSLHALMPFTAASTTPHSVSSSATASSCSMYCCSVIGKLRWPTNWTHVNTLRVTSHHGPST